MSSDSDEKSSGKRKFSDIKLNVKSGSQKTWRDKITAPFESFVELFEDISPKYIISVAAAVLFCVLVIGIVLIVADPSAQVDRVTRSAAVEIPADKKIHVKIKEGMTTAEIADELSRKGVIASSLKFRILSRLRGNDGKMRPGTYTFTPGMAEDDVFRKLLTGEKHLVRFTIPEGFTVKEIAERLYNLDIADKEDFLKAAKRFAPYEYMKGSDVRYEAEGFLFPETYSVESDYSIEEILRLMAGELDGRLTPEMRDRARDMNLSLRDLITLASLVEREVRYPEDRKIVAQVFLKRLEIDMPLQTDASLQYLMNAPKEDVSIKDTQIESPYNTYLNRGLPPGPIASPGMESIDAVLNPADTDYLYFVADRQGHNHYSYTYDEHLMLVNQYR